MRPVSNSLRSFRSLLALPAACVLAATYALAKDPEVPSSFRTATVTVDGVADEWAGKLVPLASTPFFVGVQNDASFVYVCLRTSDAAVKKQVLAVGLSVYLDASGDSRRAFGVRFPVGRLAADLDLPSTGDTKTENALALSVAGAELEILGRDAVDNGRMRVPEAHPIEAALGEDGAAALVIELKVPLAFGVDSPLAIETAAGKTIALGIDTTPPKRRKPSREDGFAPAQPAGGGLGRGGPYLGGGIPRRTSPSTSEGSREVVKSFGKAQRGWISVPLAPAPVPAS